MTQAEFAALVGTTQGTISKICENVRRPSWAMAARIEQATNGEVQIATWAQDKAGAA